MVEKKLYCKKADELKSIDELEFSTEVNEIFNRMDPAELVSLARNPIFLQKTIMEDLRKHDSLTPIDLRLHKALYEVRDMMTAHGFLRDDNPFSTIRKIHSFHGMCNTEIYVDGNFGNDIQMHKRIKKIKLLMGMNNFHELAMEDKILYGIMHESVMIPNELYETYNEERAKITISLLFAKIFTPIQRELVEYKIDYKATLSDMEKDIFVAAVTNFYNNLRLVISELRNTLS